MSLDTNRQFRLAARPVGFPKRSDWTFNSEPVPTPAEGEFLVRISHLSLDPAMRGWMNEAKSYIPPVALGDVMRAGGGGQVIQSRHPDFRVGDSVVGAFGVQDYALSDGRGVDTVDLRLASLPVYIGTLGMSGMTAYFGLLDVGQVEPGDTVVVSGAAGAVGSVVGQIARLKGCRVIGIAGGPDKCRYLTDDLGFDGAVDYKSQDLRKVLRQLCPKGINVFFDNVGGEILNTALTQLARGARVVICGAISQYNSTSAISGPSNYLSLLVYRASMKGMVVFDYVERYGEAMREMAQWLAAGQLKSREYIVEGLENFPDALLQLFNGDNTGKMVLRIAP